MNDSPGHWKKWLPPNLLRYQSEGDLHFSWGLLSKSTWIPHLTIQDWNVAPICTLWHAVVCYYWSCTLAIPEARRALHVWQSLWNNKMTVSQIRKTISPAAVLLRGIINLNMTLSAYLYTNKVRLRNFLWTISVMCSYFVPPACYKWLHYKYIIIAVP